MLCSDEKSQCQALERTQPGLPLGQGHIRTRTHDYYRHGTVTLFAALDYLSGKVFAHTAPRHRHQEWLAFLRKIDKEVAPELELHIICDNYSTHKHAKVTAWLKRHPRFHLHFIPTSSSWLNLVERFFGEITAKVIRPGSFRSVGALVADIFRFLDHQFARIPSFDFRVALLFTLRALERRLLVSDSRPQRPRAQAIAYQ